MIDLASLVKLMNGKMDLSTAAATFGLAQRTLTQREEMVQALTVLAEAAALAGPTVEVIYITGQPGVLKGRKVRVLAVLGDFPDEEKKQQLSS